MHLDRTIIISGAGIAGLVAAHRLAERGFRPVVVEQAPVLRAAGHASISGAARSKSSS